MTEEQAKIKAMAHFLKDLKALAISRGDKELENLASQGLCHCGCHTRDWWIEPCLHCTPKGCAGERYV